MSTRLDGATSKIPPRKCAGGLLETKEKAPALSGRGFAVSAGGGRGCRSPRGVRAERRPRLRVPEKKCRSDFGTPDKRSAPECVPRRFADSCPCRRLSPVPDSSLAQKSDSEKR